MPSIRDVARRDEVKQAVLKMESPTGVKFRLEVSFRPNVVTDRMSKKSKPGDDDSDDEEEGGLIEQIENSTAMRAAEVFTSTFVSWDLTGPLVDGDGKEIVGENEPIPLEPAIVRWVPGWLRGQALTRVNEIIFPNLKGFRT